MSKLVTTTALFFTVFVGAAGVGCGSAPDEQTSASSDALCMGPDPCSTPRTPRPSCTLPGLNTELALEGSCWTDTSLVDPFDLASQLAAIGCGSFTYYQVNSYVSLGGPGVAPKSYGSENAAICPKGAALDNLLTAYQFERPHLHADGQVHDSRLNAAPCGKTWVFWSDGRAHPAGCGSACGYRERPTY